MPGYHLREHLTTMYVNYQYLISTDNKVILVFMPQERSLISNLYLGVCFLEAPRAIKPV